MRFARTVGIAAAFSLCALGLAVTATAGAAPPTVAQVLGERGQAMAAHYAAMSEPAAVAIPHGAAREDMFVAVAEGSIVRGERWGAEPISGAQQANPAPVRVDSVSFDWGDAGLGAFAALGAVAVLGAAAYGLRSRAAGRPPSGATS